MDKIHLKCSMQWAIGLSAVVLLANTSISSSTSLKKTCQLFSSLVWAKSPSKPPLKSWNLWICSKILWSVMGSEIYRVTSWVEYNVLNPPVHVLKCKHRNSYGQHKYHEVIVYIFFTVGLLDCEDIAPSVESKYKIDKLKEWFQLFGTTSYGLRYRCD